MSYSTTIHDQAANLYAQAQDGDTESLEEFMRMHEGLVHHIVRQQWRGRLSYEQAIHAGRIGLWHAAALSLHLWFLTICPSYVMLADCADSAIRGLTVPWSGGMGWNR